MEINRIEDGSSLWGDFVRLYEEAFPADEKKPLSRLLALQAEEKAELLALTENGAFAGLAAALTGRDAAVLDYFAVRADRRGGGLGTRALGKIGARYAGRPLILEIEALDPAAGNAVQRERRRNFYLRNGLKSTGLFVRVYDTDMELLSYRPVTFEQYAAVLAETVGTGRPGWIPRQIPAPYEA